MANCNYNCAELPAHQQVDCAAYSLGGISANAYLECDHTIADFTSAAEWEANIASGKAYVFQGVKGEIPAASVVQVDNPIGCGAAQIPIGFDNPFTIKDFNVNANNDDVYAKINLRRLIPVVFMCEQNEIRVASEAAVITAPPATVPEGNRVQQMYQTQGTFFSKVGEIPWALYDAPDGIFTE